MQQKNSNVSSLMDSYNLVIETMAMWLYGCVCLFILKDLS